MSISTALPRAFFERPATEVAPALLDCVIRCGDVSLRITEVEAYEGTADPGSHAFRGRSRRNATMFGPAGHLYVYRHMGLHHCMNTVCLDEGTAAGVLIRAGEIVAGQGFAYQRRLAKGVCRRDEDLARGPARLTTALGIEHEVDGADLCGGESGLYLTGRSDVPSQISTGPRVGVSGIGGDRDHYPWRYWITGDPTVSLYTPAPRPKRRR